MNADAIALRSHLIDVDLAARLYAEEPSPDAPTAESTPTRIARPAFRLAADNGGHAECAELRTIWPRLDIETQEVIRRTIWQVREAERRRLDPKYGQAEAEARRARGQTEDEERRAEFRKQEGADLSADTLVDKLYMRGVGPKRRAVFHEQGIVTLADAARRTQREVRDVFGWRVMCGLENWLRAAGLSFRPDSAEHDGGVA